MCEPSWGETPSADLRLPDELIHPPETHDPVVGNGASAAAATDGPGTVHDTWYGFYPSGREVLLAIEDVRGQQLAAVYVIGPGIDKSEPAEWSRRAGQIMDDDFVFEEQGKSTLRFHSRADGGLKATWISPDGKRSMKATLRRIDLQQFSRRLQPQ